MTLTKSERETVILFDDEESRAQMYTLNRGWKTKMDKLCKKHPDEFMVLFSHDDSKTYRFPKRLITIRSPRELSQNQKDSSTQRLKQAREKQHFTRKKKSPSDQGKGGKQNG